MHLVFFRGLPKGGELLFLHLFALVAQLIFGFSAFFYFRRSEPSVDIP